MEPDDVVVVDAYVVVLPDSPLHGSAEMTALLHRTLEVDGATGEPPPAEVTVTRPADGASWTLAPDRLAACAFSRPVIVGGACYRAVDRAGLPVHPGDALALEVALADGRRLASEAVVPGGFELLGVEGSCLLAERTATELRWTRSEGAWAYLVETLLYGLPPHFEAEVDEPLYLLGLAVSAADTALVFPREVGLFARGELEREVALYLQEGLPPAARGPVTVTAVDRNWVNWVRGGSFNPSGQVRVPSVRGAGGTGVFGAGVMRRVDVAVPPHGGTAPPCPPPPEAP